MAQIAELHEPIVDACERGDAKLAARLLREHSLGFAAQVGTSCQDLTVDGRKISRVTRVPMAKSQS